MLHQVISILFPVFVLVCVGYLVGRCLKPDFRPINRINMDVFTPALVFSSLVGMPLSMGQVPLLLAALIAVVVPGIVMVPIAKFCGLSFKAWAPPHMFRNSGNLAIPLFTYTFGEIALPSAVLLFVVSACLHISLGVMLLSNGNPLKQIVKMPIFLSALLALLINISGIGIWSPLFEATTLLGRYCRPSYVVIIGSTNAPFKMGWSSSGSLVHTSITRYRSTRLCLNLYLDTIANHAITDDGVVYHVATSCNELLVC